MHDIGKYYTKSYGKDGQAHYLQHHSVSAYESLLYMAAGYPELTLKDMLYVSNLIYYHMRPGQGWNVSPRALSRDRALLGEDMFSDVMLLHEADLAAKDRSWKNEYKKEEYEENEFEHDR